MINPIELYRDSGHKAGRAMNRGDIATVQFESGWMLRAARLETPEDRKAAHKAYSEAYKFERDCEFVRKLAGHRGGSL